MHHFRHSTVAHVDTVAVAVMDFIRRLAAHVHQRRLELLAFGSAEQLAVVNCRETAVKVARGAAHAVGALMSPVTALKSGGAHASRAQQLALDVVLPRLARG